MSTKTDLLKTYTVWRKYAYKQKTLLNPYYKLLVKTHRLMNHVIKRMHKEQIKNASPLDLKDSIIHIYLTRALHFNMAHYSILRSGTVAPGYPILRSIYETILRVYSMACYSEIALLESKYRTRYKRADIKEIETEYKKWRYLKVDELENKLYASSSKSWLRKLYKNLCEYTHPGIDAMNMCYGVVEGSFKDSVHLGLSFCLYIAVLVNEIYENIITSRYKKIFYDMREPLEKMMPEGLPLLIPTKQKCLDKLKIKTPYTILQP